jgi:hypothetical protein
MSESLLFKCCYNTDLLASEVKSGLPDAPTASPASSKAATTPNAASQEVMYEVQYQVGGCMTLFWTFFEDE